MLDSVTCSADRTEEYERTHKSTNGGQELTLHRLPLRETTADEDRVISDLVGNLVCEARQRRRRADQG